MVTQVDHSLVIMLGATQPSVALARQVEVLNLAAIPHLVAVAVAVSKQAVEMIPTPLQMHEAAAVAPAVKILEAGVHRLVRVQIAVEALLIILTMAAVAAVVLAQLAQSERHQLRAMVRQA